MVRRAIRVAGRRTKRPELQMPNDTGQLPNGEAVTDSALVIRHSAWTCVPVPLSYRHAIDHDAEIAVVGRAEHGPRVPRRGPQRDADRLAGGPSRCRHVG